MDLEEELEDVGDLNKFVKAALVKSEDEAEEKWLYCESEAKEAIALAMKQSFSSRYEEELKKLADGLTKPKGRKKFTKVVERVGRLKEKHKRISGSYEVNIIASEDGTTATALRENGKLGLKNLLGGILCCLQLFLGKFMENPF